MRGKKILGVSDMLRYSIKKVLAEIEKCEVRCANCHAIVTRERRYGKDERNLIYAN
jgi:hypothetical protein